MKRLTVLLISTLAAFTFLTACENEDQNKVALAQQCLDQVTDATFSTATSCLNHLGSLDTQQANILRCSIALVSGGLTTSRIMNSFESLNSGDAGESAFIALLTMESSGGASGALTIATNAASYCNATDDKGLMFLGNMAVLGTTLATDVGGIDFTNINESTLTSGISAAVTACASGGGSCDRDLIGTAVLVLGDSYCEGSYADEGVCQEINQAVAGGGSTTDIANALLALL